MLGITLIALGNVEFRMWVVVKMVGEDVFERFGMVERNMKGQEFEVR